LIAAKFHGLAAQLDLRLLLSALMQVYSVVPLDDFPKHAFSILDRLIPEPILALDDTELSTG
jgi:hypothetical protein